jgi:hypothetical protein
MRKEIADFILNFEGLRSFEKEFLLKQIVASIVLDNICDHWKDGFIPSIDTKEHQMINKLCEMVRQSFVYLKERWEIVILENPENGSNQIFGEGWIESLGVKKSPD